MNLCNKSMGPKFAFNEYYLTFVNLSDLQVHALNLYFIVAPFTVSGRCNKKQIHNTDVISHGKVYILDYRFLKTGAVNAKSKADAER